MIAIILLIPTLTLIAVLTNELHHLIWTDIVPINGVPNAYLFSHGPFYWIGIGFDYICGIASVLLIILDMRQSSKKSRTQSRWLLFSSLFPFATSLVYDLGFTPIPGFEILPIGFSISGIGLVFSIIFLKIFDIIPVSRSLLVENLQDGVIIFDNLMQVVDINPSARHLLEIDQIDLGMDINDFPEICLPALSEKTKQTEIHIDGNPGKTLLFLPNTLVDDTAKPAGSMFVIRDMTEIRAVENALQQSQSRYQSLIEDVLDISTVGICILDNDFKVVWINQADAIDWLGDRAQLLGKAFRSILKNYSPVDINDGDRVIGEILMSYHSSYFLEDVEIYFRSRNTNPGKVLQYSSRPITIGYFTGGRIEQFIDISEQKLLQNKIELLAITDELTGIYNRRGLMEFGRHDFNRARRTNTELGVIYFDIDFFKEMNDKFGHLQGDAILKETVHHVESCLRDMDTFARFGGDEFVILVPEADQGQTVEIAKRIRKKISSSPIIIGEIKVQVNLSLGISQIRPTDSLTGLLNRADQAMYRAKQSGRGHIEIYDE
jgi:diguanylate cyclase (GGDEF)-like protein